MTNKYFMQRMVELYEKNKILITQTQEIIDACHVQNYNHVARTFKLFTGNVATLVNDLSLNEGIFNPEGDDEYKVRLTMTLQDILKAQEKDDYILISDTLEVNMVPLLYELQNVLSLASNTENTSNKFWINIECLKKTDSELAEMLVKRYEKMKQYGRTLGIITSDEEPQITVQGYYDEELKKAYYIERTQSGYPTLKIESDTEEFYLCGNVNPYRDSNTLFNSYFNVDANEYIICGMDIGYLPNAVYGRISDAVPVLIYESDINVMVFAFECSVLTTLIERGYRFIYDTNFQLLSKKLLKKKDNDILIMQHPAIRNISNVDIRDRAESLFVQDASVRNQLFDMTVNLKSNIEYCNHYVDELKDEIYGKDVFIIAAGPSLEHNIDLLKNKLDDSVIIAVGRVYHMLESIGIKPNYYVFLDSAARTYGFISGHEENYVPLLICSTACRHFAKNSKADKYLICQEGFPEAEAYAELKGYQTYETGGSVATIAFDVALRLGAKRIITLGLDLAYTDNHTHSTGAYTTLLKDTSGLVMVKGINDEELYTTKAMDMYRIWFEERIKKARVEGYSTEFLNATEGGANIQGMKNVKLKDVI